MAIKEPKKVSRTGEKRIKEVGDRSYAIAKGILFGGIASIILSGLSFYSKQWLPAIVFLVAAVVSYIPYKHIYSFGPIAFRLDEEGIVVFHKNDEEEFVPYGDIQRVTVFNPEIKGSSFFIARRNVYLTLKTKVVVREEEKNKVVRITLPYESDAVYFKLLQAKVDFDGVPIER